MTRGPGAVSPKVMAPFETHVEGRGTDADEGTEARLTMVWQTDPARAGAIPMDVRLVEAARAGEQDALDELIAQYLPLVYNVVGRALARRSDVDDVVQDTMLRVVHGLPGLRDPQRFRSWLVAITMNQVRDHHQSRGADAAALDEITELADPGADFVDLTLTELGLSGQRREVAQATRWLDPDDRHLLSLWWLVTAGHLTRAELVNALELDPHHVTVRVARMKGQLEGARLVVRALAAMPGCSRLADTAASWTGEPAPLWRKRFARHIRECGYCPSDVQELIPAERLLAGLALLPLPAGYTAYMLSSVHAVGLTTPTEQLRIPQKRHGTGAHRRGAHGGSFFAKPVLGLAVVTAAVGIGLAVVYGVKPGATTAAPAPGPVAISVTASAQPSSAAAIPLPSTAAASPSASPSPSAKPSPPPRHTTAPAAPPPGTGSSSTTTPASSVASGPVQQVLALINQARASAGLPAYTITSGLTTSATGHNQTMANGCGLSHQCPGEPALGDRETAAGVQWTSAGENIGDGGPVSDTDSAIAQMAVGLTQDMLNEKPPNDGHRQNILSSSFHHIGIAIVRDSSGTVWMTQDFSN